MSIVSPLWPCLGVGLIGVCHILNWGVLMLFLDAFWLVSWKAQDRKRRKTEEKDKTKQKKKKDKCDDWIWTPKLID